VFERCRFDKEGRIRDVGLVKKVGFEMFSFGEEGRVRDIW
jgi:hypothetical protein